MKEMLTQAKMLLKQTEQQIKASKPLRSTLAQTERIVHALLYNPEEAKRIITKWEDVNETYRLAHKGAALRANYNRNRNILNLVFTLLRLAAAFPPVAAKVVPVVKVVDTVVAAVKAVVPKAVADALPEPIAPKPKVKKTTKKAKPKKKVTVKKSTKKSAKSTAKSKGGRKSKLLED